MASSRVASCVYETCFTAADIMSIAVAVVGMGRGTGPGTGPGTERGRFDKACAAHLFNHGHRFSDDTRALLRSSDDVFEKVKEAVKNEYNRLSEFFKEYFTAADIKSISQKVVQLGKQRDRYRLACDNCRKPNCPFRFNFHPETGA